MQEEPMTTNQPGSDIADISAQQSGVLLVSIMLVAACGIAYELIISTVSSYLLGDSVVQFSLTIGLFMFAMGSGSYLSKLIGEKRLIENFILVEMAIAMVGGVCSICLFVVFAALNPFYKTVMYSFIMIIGVLVGLEIPILTAILSKRESLRKSLAHVLSLDYVGALIGSVAFPLFLLPTLGLIRTSFAVGLVNILTALVTLLFFRKSIARSGLWIAGCVAILIAMIAFVIGGTFLSRYAEKQLYFDQIIQIEQTPYQRVVVTQNRTNNDHRLYIDGHIQFSSRDEHRYHEALVHPVMAPAGPRENVLILGGGDGLAAREVLKYQDVKQIDLVDIDPAISRLAQELPLLRKLTAGSFDDPRLKLHHQDAFIFINKPGTLYDRVIIDMPDPHNEVLNKLYSREFYTMIKRRMNPDAILVSQSSSPFFTRRTFWCIEKTLADVFTDTDSYHVTIPSFGVWGFNLAGNALPDNSQLPLTVETRYLDSDVMQAALVFGKDMDKIDMPVNSIMEPVLYQLYIDDLNSPVAN